MADVLLAHGRPCELPAGACRGVGGGRKARSRVGRIDHGVLRRGQRRSPLGGGSQEGILAPQPDGDAGAAPAAAFNPRQGRHRHQAPATLAPLRRDVPGAAAVAEPRPQLDTGPPGPSPDARDGPGSAEKGHVEHREGDRWRAAAPDPPARLPPQGHVARGSRLFDQANGGLGGRGGLHGEGRVGRRLLPPRPDQGGRRVRAGGGHRTGGLPG
mmetsp:Transcript_62244/g.185429  ORF Transcript_62244/g.185429 Transcript_62244/m.185429 type:complete len:213 (-) Transcript_62244:1121-1759(-)